MSSKFSIGAMNQLADALEKAGFTADDITRLKQYRDLTKIKQLLIGHAEISNVKYVVDLGRDAFIPSSGWRVDMHHKGEHWQWSADKLGFYLYEGQEIGIRGYELCRQFENMPVFNANLLDYLLKNKQLIPAEWKDRTIYFWGTIYSNAGCHQFVRSLRWEDGWCDGYDCLSAIFKDNDFAIVLVD